MVDVWVIWVFVTMSFSPTDASISTSPNKWPLSEKALRDEYYSNLEKYDSQVISFGLYNFLNKGKLIYSACKFFCGALIFEV